MPFVTMVTFSAILAVANLFTKIRFCRVFKEAANFLVNQK